MNKYYIASEILRLSLPIMKDTLRAFTENRNKPLEKKTTVPSINSFSLPESSIRHKKYIINRINDQRVRKMAEGCNKAIDALEARDYSKSLFEIRKVMENLLVYVIKENNFYPKNSYKSATNLKICRRYNFIDELSAQHIDRCRAICGDNTHQLGYEDSLSADTTREVVYHICDVLDRVLNKYEPIYQA